MSCIFVIDDEPNILQVVERVLCKEGHDVHTYQSPAEAMTALPAYAPVVVISDIKMEEMDGFAVLNKVKAFNNEINVILITAYASIETAVEALRTGAFDYLIKPFKIEELRLIVCRALSEKVISGDKKEHLKNEHEFIIVGEKMQEIARIVTKVAATNSTVLISGESGTGKELVSRAIYRQSERVQGPFVSINCAALPDSLLESELFGHEKGSFTGAVNTKIGLMEYADGGTIFLDEIGDISPPLQVKLLRALQEKEIKRVGGLIDITVDARVIAATSKNLEDEVAHGRFREDLFYRLNVIPIYIPPLRERKEDIPVLIDHIIGRLNKKHATHITLTPEAHVLLLQYNWPGNVRELENTLERLMTLIEGEVIDKDAVKRQLGLVPNSPQKEQGQPLTLKKEAEEVEKQLILGALKETAGNKMRAAKKLNISRQSLQYKIKKHRLDQYD